MFFSYLVFQSVNWAFSITSAVWNLSDFWLTAVFSAISCCIWKRPTIVVFFFSSFNVPGNCWRFQFVVEFRAVLRVKQLGRFRLSSGPVGPGSNPDAVFAQHPEYFQFSYKPGGRRFVSTFASSSSNPYSLLFACNNPKADCSVYSLFHANLVFVVNGRLYQFHFHFQPRYSVFLPKSSNTSQPNRFRYKE